MTWNPPQDWLRLTTIDVHTAGEPLRVITSGFPELLGDTILAKRRHAREEFDHLRRALMLEPRGHADMYGCILTPPTTPDGDVGVLFLHNEGYSTMCGHGIIGLVKAGLECGLLPTSGPIVRIDTPAGRVVATANVVTHRVESVSFENVASFAAELDLTIEVPGLGSVCCDIGFGGAFYAYVDAPAIGLTLEPAHTARIIDIGMRIKRAVMDACQITHPDGDEELGFLYGTIFSQPGEGAVFSRNVCVFANGEVDRSPTGTGVSGRAALLAARGELTPGRMLTIESLIGTRFEVGIVRTCTIGSMPAIVPEVRGTAYITGRHEFFIDPDDPLRGGVLLR